MDLIKKNRAFASFLPFVVWAIVLSTGFATFASNSDCIQLLREDTAFAQMVEIQDQDNRQKYFHEMAPRQTVSYGAQAPIVHSFEKEGLYYNEIAHWFSILKPAAKEKLQKQFAREVQLPVRRRKLHAWLRSIKKLEATKQLSGLPTAKQWRDSSEAQRLQILTQLEDPFMVLAIDYKSALFELEILNFNDVQAGPNAPKLITVGDDLGSYEVRMTQGVADRTKYLQLREVTEAFLEGDIGHQHLFHAWPDDPQLRAKIAPKYIELLDATTWYLFWRQMNRSPKDVSSILTHQFLGVYTKPSLDRLYQAVVNGEPKKFNNKFRMVGARSFKASADIPEQGTGFVPDWELRSGNKGIRRELVEIMIEARLSSGDYSGLEDYQNVVADPSAPTKTILQPFLSEKQMAVIAKFEKHHPAMKYNSHPLTHNHIRNRILSPLLPWAKRLPIPLKEELLKNEQLKYAKKLLSIARNFLSKLDKNKNLSTVALGELRADTVEKLEQAIYDFAKLVRLDLDFEQYLTPVPIKTVSLDVAVSGPINVNELPIGIEYSFRFPKKAKPLSRNEADEDIQDFSEKLQASFGTSQSAISANKGDSHGHGTVVKYAVGDAKSQPWRVEWDGISRYYVDGKIRRAWGGHVEVPSPKFVPHSIDDGIRQMFSATREMSMVSRRFAGGGHFNIDIEKLISEYPSDFAARRIANLVSYFESNQELILFMWMHPLRMHAAYPIILKPDFANRIDTFNGNIEELGRLLYEARYFNQYVGRKPKYVPLNVTALMTPFLPDVYTEKSLDIRKPGAEWFPSFGKVTGRLEARFFDAPINENMAALQIQYFRSVLNLALNAKEPIIFQKKFSSADYERWVAHPDQWFQDASAHLKELNVNPNDYKWLLWDSFNNRKNFEMRKKEYVPHQEFLPLKSAPEKISYLFRPQHSDWYLYAA